LLKITDVKRVLHGQLVVNSLGELLQIDGLEMFLGPERLDAPDAVDMARRKSSATYWP